MPEHFERWPERREISLDAGRGEVYFRGADDGEILEHQAHRSGGRLKSLSSVVFARSYFCTGRGRRWGAHLPWRMGSPTRASASQLLPRRGKGAGPNSSSKSKITPSISSTLW